MLTKYEDLFTNYYFFLKGIRDYYLDLSMEVEDFDTRVDSVKITSIRQIVEINFTLSIYLFRKVFSNDLKDKVVYISTALVALPLTNIFGMLNANGKIKNPIFFSKEEIEKTGNGILQLGSLLVENGKISPKDYDDLWGSLNDFHNLSNITITEINSISKFVNICHIEEIKQTTLGNNIPNFVINYDENMDRVYDICKNTELNIEEEFLNKEEVIERPQMRYVKENYSPENQHTVNGSKYFSNPWLWLIIIGMVFYIIS
jgi:hypothetical protein